MAKKFIQIGELALNLDHIIEVRFSENSVWITTAERDGDESGVFKFSGAEADAIKRWWGYHIDVHRIV